jgi:hypothetical protein
MWTNYVKNCIPDLKIDFRAADPRCVALWAESCLEIGRDSVCVALRADLSPGNGDSGEYIHERERERERIILYCAEKSKQILQNKLRFFSESVLMRFYYYIIFGKCQQEFKKRCNSKYEEKA